MLEVTATDPSEAATTVMVMITIKDLNEARKYNRGRSLRTSRRTAPGPVASFMRDR